MKSLTALSGSVLGSLAAINRRISARKAGVKPKMVGPLSVLPPQLVSITAKIAKTAEHRFMGWPLCSISRSRRRSAAYRFADWNSRIGRRIRQQTCRVGKLVNRITLKAHHLHEVQL